MPVIQSAHINVSGQASQFQVKLPFREEKSFLLSSLDLLPGKLQKNQGKVWIFSRLKTPRSNFSENVLDCVRLNVSNNQPSTFLVCLLHLLQALLQFFLASIFMQRIFCSDSPSMNSPPRLMCKPLHAHLPIFPSQPRRFQQLNVKYLGLILHPQIF